MKKLFFLSCALLLVGLAGCDALSPLSDKTPDFAFGDPSILGCGADDSVFNLIRNGNSGTEFDSPVGTVTINNDEDFLYVQIATVGFPLDVTNLYVGTLPPGKGQSGPGSLGNQVIHSGVNSYTYEVPLGEWFVSQAINIVVHAKSGSVDAFAGRDAVDPDDADAPVRYGPGNSFATYLTYRIQECTAAVEGYEACKHSDWNNLDGEFWPVGFSSETLFSSIFLGSDETPINTVLGETFADAFVGGADIGNDLEGRARKLLRFGGAAYLNAVHPAVDFPHDAAAIATAVNNGLTRDTDELDNTWRGRMNSLASQFDELIDDADLGCPLPPAE